MLRVLPANAALRNWKIGHIFFENKFLEAENEVQKIVVPIQLLHVKVECLRTQIDQGKCENKLHKSCILQKCVI